jgi:glutamine amidotransferase
MKKITVVDYGAGNILSIINAVNFLGYTAEVSSKANVIKNSDILILPGVGSFYRAMLKLQDLGIDDAIREFCLIKKKNFLGICLGMQLMADMGNEEKKIKGLSLIRGQVKNLKNITNLQLPHIGFNLVESNKENILFNDLKNKYFYFIHSYFFEETAKEENIKFDYCTYGQKFISSFQKENLFGTQFHPEKIQTNGLKILQNFLNI